MIAFDPTSEQHEGLVVKWWADLEPDRAVTFHSSLFRLSAFLRYFTQQAGLIFDCDQNGIWFAVWTEPFCDGVAFSVWVRPDKRHSPATWRNLRVSYNLVFDRWRRVVGYTRQPSLHAEHLKLGYQYCGNIPDIIDGKGVYIYSMSREQWQGRKDVAVRIRSEKRAKRQPRNGAIQEHA